MWPKFLENVLFVLFLQSECMISPWVYNQPASSMYLCTSMILSLDATTASTKSNRTNIQWQACWFSCWWLNQPIQNICSSNWIVSPGRGENKKSLKPPPSANFGLEVSFHLNRHWIFGLQRKRTERFQKGLTFSEIALLPSATWDPNPVQIASKRESWDLNSGGLEIPEPIQSQTLAMILWLVVGTHLKNISEIGSIPQVGLKIKNIWNHHPLLFWISKIPPPPFFFGVSETLRFILQPRLRFNMWILQGDQLLNTFLHLREFSGKVFKSPKLQGLIFFPTKPNPNTQQPQESLTGRCGVVYSDPQKMMTKHHICIKWWFDSPQKKNDTWGQTPVALGSLMCLSK